MSISILSGMGNGAIWGSGLKQVLTAERDARRQKKKVTIRIAK